MSARIIDGKAVAARVRAQVATEVAEFTAQRGGTPPGLATILVGDDAASAVYVGGKQKACAEVGIRGFDHRLPADTSREDLLALVEQLNADPEVSGVLCQLPLPGHLDGVEITNAISAAKDVDGLTIASAGRLALGMPGLRPCTPSGVIELLAEAGTELQGAECVVIGRSNLFGKPMAQLLLQHNATVTICHSRTKDLAATCRGADVLIAAVGVAHLVKGDWVKPGAVVVDVGMNRLDGKLTGDVDFAAASEVASAITPVPGGVGPTTIAFLLRNTLEAARAQAGVA
ncbi:bifunctional methylenetetrahydrofolate dehydrogenase/methenyltetrahydrofolate cyclohydrolase FolD [Paraconexibacter algicola]|uniref:Bifunctional protein FolD n=1 Tax=Paraconexibacter algicola TaxID=2133960 RepID=A0A2T4UB88_9ACTN|nr:bifunctional methylenetetrahydrofolate dehydrogenase/methenyltetrahydrofolate cyclohydrolase FolD [Paraconexibacter algicola]PTL54136.1 bifunctional methylenetetrahydrofolate dehydrogenase/methenyltetrahydrofolate cyclohydrolase FolD [Paraconexibacter algicola]